MMHRRGFLLGGAALAVAGRAMAQQQGDGKVRPDERSVFIVVDVQNCFVPGGSLAVQKGDEVVPLINKLAKGFRNVVLTQDWHTPDHVSFASQHAGKKPFEMIELPYGKQVLWPDHCVQGTRGRGARKGPRHPARAARHPQGLPARASTATPPSTRPTRKTADRPRRLSEAARPRERLRRRPRDRFLRRLHRARRAQGRLRCYVVEDACRGIDAQGSLAAAWTKMSAAGVKRIQSGDIVFPA